MKQNVYIIGLGLIGASLAIAIKKEHPAIHLTGWDFSEETRKIAQEKHIVDEIPESFENGAQQADVILLAVPIKTSLNYLRQLADLPLKQGVLVTDAGSTKQEIMALAETLPFDFIGGHPMAGSHKSGVLAANGDLFENAYFIFTIPEDEVVAKRVTELQTLFKGTRSKYVLLSSVEHDQITGMLSHFPHIIASGLVNQADVFNQIHPRAKQLAAGGFRDITRIASSDPQMWTDILLSNRESLIALIATWQQQMSEVSEWLSESNRERIFQFFENAKDTRDKLPIHSNGAIPAFYDLFVDVPDKPGAIAEIMSILAEAAISVINVKILETREDIVGVLQITFKTQQDLQEGQSWIEKRTNYPCRLK
ncbi:prephenate dehydrogenase [Enterococcus saccharolyticus]|uniref:Prephenate dehydrogenase n=1 Tax=Candidatus Enterococcus willemsii TaxID=1857215 RepID=A0ABQ6YX07_9ENTE|nr:MULTISPECIES: prephenate dehydrogenase [Enterococcus]KAF1301518.1 prephenate dehydrogenase [Enterococcus sp. CU12B]MCD5003171.1 prephenate dehydrogenase [Enterococcus saccharolyticus]